MAFYTSYSDKRFLILDDMPEVRSTLRSQVGSLGCENVVLCSTVKDALESLSSKSVDVILCDFYLAGGTDGQQFLEFLRNRSIIKRGVLFIMITAEKSYEQVVTTAECLPDDYLLKPFTAESLQLRLERLLEKKRRLEKVDQLQDRKNWKGVIVACDEIIGVRDRYLFDALRIKGNALIQAGQHDTAVAFYEEMLAQRAMPWVKLGLARALYLQKDHGRSKDVLKGLIEESPRLMAAYDLLGHVHMDLGDADEAIAILDSACEISPNSLARHRAIATVAEQKGDHSRVEQALDRVIKRTRNSPLRDASDFARLGSALTEMGQVDRAISLLEDVRTNFKNDAHHPHLAAVEAIAHQKAGNPEKAAAALDRALANDPGKQPEAVAVALARACLTTGRHDQADRIFKKLMQDNPDSGSLKDRVTAVFAEHGLPERGERLIAESVQEIVQLNNEAVGLAKSGQLGKASGMLMEAAHRLPGNLQIVANAASALFLDVFHNGLDPAKLKVAQGFRQQVESRQPNHPKLADIAELVSRIQAKYAQGGGS